MADIQPIGEYVVLERVEAEEKTPGGIVLPDRAKEKPKEGVVVAVGRGKILPNGRLREPELKPKDHVVYSAYAGTEVKLEGKEYLVLREDDVLAVLD